jgi:hypothetical protein
MTRIKVVLGELFFSVQTLSVALKELAYIMPLTYANIAPKDKRHTARVSFVHPAGP